MALNTKDVRWLQRLSNFNKALVQLDDAMELMQLRQLSRLGNRGGH